MTARLRPGLRRKGQLGREARRFGAPCPDGADTSVPLDPRAQLDGVLQRRKQAFENCVVAMLAGHGGRNAPVAAEVESLVIEFFGAEESVV